MESSTALEEGNEHAPHFHLTLPLPLPLPHSGRTSVGQVQMWFSASSGSQGAGDLDVFCG
jgi:hypothetical protein